MSEFPVTDAERFLIECLRLVVIDDAFTRRFALALRELCDEDVNILVIGSIPPSDARRLRHYLESVLRDDLKGEILTTQRDEQPSDRMKHLQVVEDAG